MNEPAFPSNGYVASSLGDLHTSEKGMTLHDYFAAKAMQGIRACETDITARRYKSYEVAQMAYEDADAMLQARKNGGKDESASARNV